MMSDQTMQGAQSLPPDEKVLSAAEARALVPGHASATITITFDDDALERFGRAMVRGIRKALEEGRVEVPRRRIVEPPEASGP